LDWTQAARDPFYPNKVPINPKSKIENPKSEDRAIFAPLGATLAQRQITQSEF